MKGPVAMCHRPLLRSGGGNSRGSRYSAAMRHPETIRRTRLLLVTSAAACWATASQVAAQSADPTALDDVVVTGSRLAGGQRVAPIQVIDRETLDRVAVAEPAQLLPLLTANSGSEARVDQLNQPQSSGTAQFNLRNLGLGSTLVLVDGTRWTTSAAVATDGATFVDINALLPIIAVERVEVIKDGASAIYGSDAVAGVVNFVTRTGPLRPEARLRQAIADGGDETTIEALTGFSLGGGQLVLAASHLRRSSIGSNERDFTQAEHYGPAPWTAVTSYGQPGSYFRPSQGRFAPDPDCDDAAFGSAFRNGPSDSFCRLDYSDFFDLSPEEERTHLFADYRRPIGDLSFHLQGVWTATHTRARQSPSLPILARSPVVPASHPDNPFGEDVLFRGRLLGAEAGASVANFDYRTWRLSTGLSGRLASSWNWTMDATASRQHTAYDKPDVIGSALDDALNGFGGPDCDQINGSPGAGNCRYFNPFGSAYLGTGTTNDPALIDSLIGCTGLRGAARLLTLDAQTSGRVADWTGGTLDLALGLQYRQSGLRHDWSDLVNAGDLLTAGFSPDFEGDQAVAAAFAEARLSLGQTFDAQFAVRQEAYEGGEDAVSPRVAFGWSAMDSLSIKGSWSQGFRAPSVYTLFGAQASQPSVFDRGAFVFVNTLASGDPDLKPERSETLSLGAVWQPSEALTFSLDAWRIDYRELIVKPSAQAVIDAAAADDAAGRTGTPAQMQVTRSPSGALTFVALRFINASSVETRGLDLSARYEREVAGGRLSATATWTYVDRYDIQVAEGARRVSGVGSTNLNTLGRSLPRNRGELALSWSGALDTITVLAHHTGRYRNDRAGITDARIEASTMVDMHFSHVLTRSLDLSLSVENVADSDPPLAQFALGYDPVVADPRGRIISLGIRHRF